MQEQPQQFKLLWLAAVLEAPPIPVGFLPHGFQGQGVLGLIELGVDAVGFQQLLMGAAFGDDAVGNGDDPVGISNGAQPVGND